MEFTLEQLIAVGLTGLFAGAAIGGWVSAWILSPMPPLDESRNSEQEGGAPCGGTR